MRILADENCDRLIVVALREAGHDVRYVAEGDAGESDNELVRLAIGQKRVLLTDDLDFGRLAELEERRPPAIILMRLGRLGRAAQAKRVVSTVESLDLPIEDRVIVVEPGQIRIRAWSER